MSRRYVAIDNLSNLFDDPEEVDREDEDFEEEVWGEDFEGEEEFFENEEDDESIFNEEMAQLPDSI